MERIKVLKLNKSYYLRIPSSYVQLGNVGERSVFRLFGSMPVKELILEYRRGL